MTAPDRRQVNNIGNVSSIPLYADDSYMREFEAKVVKSGPRYVILDRTAFYPESGGQPSDTGYLIHDSARLPVFKVMKRGSDIFHYIDGDLHEGSMVRGLIDWEPRFFNMRRHSGEHLLTGLFEKAEAGPKVYSDLSRLEFQPSDIEAEAVCRIEEEFNRVIDADISLRVFYMGRREVDSGGDARKASFLEKIPGRVERLRMVEIPGYALTFCFGTHVRSTKEIGHLRGLELSQGKKDRKIVHFLLI